MTKRMNLARVLQDVAYARRMSLRELAKEIGCSASTLCRFEQGKGDLSGPTLAAVIRWLLADERSTR